MSKLILFQGDSITDGNRIRNNDWDLNHQIGHSYAYIISAKLGGEYPEKDYTFVNRGISGNRISDLYGRLKEDVINHKPDILSILIGVNDAHYIITNNSGSSPDRYEKIYQLIIDEVKESNPDIKIVICEPFTLPFEKNKEHIEKITEIVVPMQEKARLIAERNDAIFVPLQNKFTEAAEKTGPEYWIWDGVHPTVPGHQLIANEWFKHCKDIL